MIPDKVYLLENECKYETATIMCLKQKVDDGIEYTRTPIAKRFEDELPPVDLLIGYRSIGKKIWSFVHARHHFFNVPIDQIKHLEWFPVILPIEV